MKLEDMMLLLYAAHTASQQHSKALRRVVFKVAMTAEWQRVLRSRHYLQAHALHSPLDSAWTMMYERDDDLCFTDTTSLTRCVGRNIRMCLDAATAHVLSCN